MTQISLKNIPNELLSKFQIQSGVNKEFENIFNKIKKSNKKNISLLFIEIEVLNNLIYSNFGYDICYDIRYWNLKCNTNFLSLDLSKNNIYELPEILGKINVIGTLNLSYNQLKKLPKNFGDIIVGGDLNLSYNQLRTLPKSFEKIVVGGKLDLCCNEIRTLPKSFDKNTVIGGDLDLSYNELSTLPKNFSEIIVGCCIFLHYNIISTLPKKFGGTKEKPFHIKGNLYIHNNILNILPKSFKYLKVEKTLDLINNNL